MRDRGATTAREPGGELTFRLPPPWKLARVGWLGLITRGTATLSAWGGGPWRVSYRLYFGALQTATAVITLGLVVVGWQWPRLTLLSAVLALWIAGYAALHVLAARHFRALLSNLMVDVVERRAQPRTPSNAARAVSQQPE